MNTEFNPQVLSIAFRFYSRVILFPYDELTHEFQHMLREMEKNIETDIDNTVASNILDIINFYQAEDMSSLQAEYARLFALTEESKPPVPVTLRDLKPSLDIDLLRDLLYDTGMVLDQEDNPDSLVNIMDYQAFLLEENLQEAESFMDQYIKPFLSDWCGRLYRESTLDFYREAAKGLIEMIRLLE
ncbi:MAG: molecular chaperone TorD family protein [Calditrichaceae bacterium]|nr:molecular chaperone TorD family protein [Calditrichaceae bacterium]MBN2710759.1 molecular chaperone TorD family protein [Calditrichaceae bacterium]RQV95709.1 MAG: hypothetical protein EH224_06760 [Calditrichota bacterium]